MKSRYIKRRKKFHYIIISVTIIVCLLGTVLTSLAILDSSRDLLIANAVNELNTKMDYIKNGIVTSPNNSYNEYVALINENVDKGNTYFQLTYDNDMTITTDNVLTVHYNDINGGILDMGTENYIRFDVLKNLLSDDEYKEICNYLNTPADKDGNISGGFKVKNFRPYLGIGWGRMIPGKIVNFSTELGVQFEGTPELYTDYGEIDESITEDDNTFNKVANALKVYPTLTFRINFKAF